MSQSRNKWQRYVDEALILTGQVCEAAIHSLDGTKMASSPNLSVSKDQIQSLLSCIVGDESSLRTNGIQVGDVSYIFLRSNPGRSIFGRLGTDAGVVVFMANKVIIIGTFKPGIQPDNCANVVEKLSDYIAKYDAST